MFLTPDELAQLTGYKTSGRQIDWLRRHGITFTINALGRPVVPREAVYQTSHELRLGVVR